MVCLDFILCLLKDAFVCSSVKAGFINWNRYYFIFGVCHFSTVKSILKLFVYCSLCKAGPGSICILLSWSKDSSVLMQKLVFGNPECWK